MGGMDFFFLEAHALIRDHPCLRGEYFVLLFLLSRMWGSPPLARGIQYGVQYEEPVIRITPAYAGNTTAR